MFLTRKMSKKILASLLFLLIVFLIIYPFLIGIYTQNNIVKLITNYNDTLKSYNDNSSLNLVEYHRGWFSSSAKAHILVQGLKNQTHIISPIEADIESKVYHWPFYKCMMCDALIQSNVIISKGPMLKIYGEEAKLIIPLETTIYAKIVMEKFFIKHQIHIPKLEQRKGQNNSSFFAFLDYYLIDDIYVQVKHFIGNTAREVVAKCNNIEVSVLNHIIQYQSQGISYVDDNLWHNKNSQNIKFHIAKIGIQHVNNGITYNVNYNLMSEYNVIYDFTQNVENASFNFALNGDLLEKQALNKKLPMPFNIAIDFSGLKSDVLQKMKEAIKLNVKDIWGILSEYLNQLFIPDHLIKGTFKGDFLPGKLLLNWQLKMATPMPELKNIHNFLQLLSFCDLNLVIDEIISRDILHYVISALKRKELLQTLDNTKDPKIRENIRQTFTKEIDNQTLNNTIKEWEQAGILIKKEKKYILHLVYAKGNFKINGYDIK